jgi:1-acyl-sn-glycerol-3-phosphate acyltransferase
VRFLVTAWLWLVFVLTSPVEFVLGVALALVTWPFDPQRRVLHAFICRWTFSYLRVWPGWRVEVTGTERIPRGGSVLIANHQSMADVVACMGLAVPFKFVSKASLFQIPLVGWMMRILGYVRLERGRPRSTQRMMDTCRQWLRNGMAVLIFPEGTYSEDRRLLPFKRGAFQLAVDERVPLVPIVLTGTTELIEGDGPWMRPRCRIRVEVQQPIGVEELGTSPEALLGRVRAQYEAWLAEQR